MNANEAKKYISPQAYRINNTGYDRDESLRAAAPMILNSYILHNRPMKEPLTIISVGLLLFFSELALLVALVFFWLPEVSLLSQGIVIGFIIVRVSFYFFVKRWTKRRKKEIYQEADEILPSVGS